MARNILKIDREACKGCGLCLSACKDCLLELSQETNDAGYHPVIIPEPDRCTGCTFCAIACPDSVIEVIRE